MSVERVTKPQTTKEYDMSAKCERNHCGDMVFEEAMVEVRVGDVKQKWCPDCVSEEFGLEYDEYSNSLPRQYITPAAAWAFVIGVTITSMLFLLFLF